MSNTSKEIVAQFEKYEGEISTLLRSISSYIIHAKKEMKHLEYTIDCLRTNNMEVCLTTHIANMGFSTRIVNCLKNDHMFWVGDLVSKSREYLLRCPMLGKVSLAEIEWKLGDHGLHLDLDTPGWEEARQELDKTRALQ